MAVIQAVCVILVKEMSSKFGKPEQ